ncbi:GTP-binding protein 1 isoform X5 [Rhinatrema bivittatum]|uniref:GTP-binding protein 1 isoform X5 n=1 Tax=Rhinatrema bivittatum TaxID=194408 RepID=UPI001125E18B|nr:GTP-binding protein 1 isoform X5 [Rhinatrema bivittatum]
MASAAAVGQSRSPPSGSPAGESPVPAYMFAPEAGAGLSGAEQEDSDCSLDGEVLRNGEPELDLTSKLVLVSPSAEQYDSLLRQLRERMDEGRGETIHVVGQGSDGREYGLNEADMEASVATVTSMAEQIGANMILLREHQEAGGKVGSNAGIVGMTKEHLGLALALNVPVFVVVTKIDMCPANILQETLKLLQRLLKSPGCRKIPVLVQNKDDVIVTASNFSSERMCPIFQISNVTGENLDLLKMFLNLLSPRSSSREEEPAEFQIDDTYSVPGVGTVVSGTTLRGLIKLNDILLLGPDPLGSFVSIAVKSIHRKRMPVKEVRGGQTASFALKKIKRSSIRKGMVMVSPRLNPQASWEFEAEILVLHHPTTISPRYQAMVHCGSIRQTATILSMNKDCLRTGDKATVHFRFIKTPEYLHIDQRLVFREGRTKAVGTVTKLLQTTNNLPMNSKPQQIKMQSTKKSPLVKKEDPAAAGEEAQGSLPAASASASVLSQAAPEDDLLSREGNKENKPKVGGSGRRRGGQRHKVKSQGACMTPASGC